MALNKTSNEYAEAISPTLYAETPKAVFAAIAASLATCGGDQLGEVDRLIVQEWAVLHANGIVPQAPPRRFDV